MGSKEKVSIRKDEAEFYKEDAEDNQIAEKKLPYPKGVFFVISIYFWERCSYYFVKSILILYLTNVLLFSEDKSTMIYHGWSTLSYFAPIFGAILADSFLGKFRTILYVSMLYATGNVILALAATPPLEIPTVAFSMMGLALIAIGTGGVKPCVSSFGGDQFKLPEQAPLLTQYFSFFYFAINSGTLISNIVAPIFRRDVSCFGESTCYSLAFAVPALLMLLVVVIFISGKSTYVMREPEENMMVKVAKCIWHGISKSCKSKESRKHWLDHADDLYEQTFIEDVKAVLRVLFLYIPLPVFWALWNQQGSRWTLQATRMDGLTFGVRIKPDQIQMSSAALILIFIPLFSYVIYPILTKLGLARKPLQRIVIGGILSGLAFVIAGIVELKLEATYPIKLRFEEANLHVINSLLYSVNISLGEDMNAFVNSHDNFVFERIPANVHHMSIATGNSPDAFFNISVEPEQAHSILVGMNSRNQTDIAKPLGADDREKSKEKAKIRFLLHGRHLVDSLSGHELQLLLRANKQGYEHQFITRKTEEGNGMSTDTLEVEPTEYTLLVRIISTTGNETLSELQIGHGMHLKYGGSYVASVSANYTSEDPTNPFDPTNYILNTYEITKANSIHMLWLLPQYIVMTSGEIFYAITGLEFSYSQAPLSMKSVVQSAWLLTVALGNLIVVIVAGAKFFDKQSKEFFLFSGIMFIDMFVFAILAYRYIPATHLYNTAAKEKSENPRLKPRL